MGDREVLGGVVRTVDAVADVGDLGERLESVQEAGRHVQVPEVVVVEQKSLLSAEGRRSSPDVDQYVVHRAVRAAHQFRLAAAAPSVHAADHTLRRPGLRVLQE